MGAGGSGDRLAADGETGDRHATDGGVDDGTNGGVDDGTDGRAGEPTRVAITGATGRMGRELLADAAGRADVAVAAATSREPAEEAVEGVDLDPVADLPALLVDRRVDVLVDFTVPEHAIEAVGAAAEAGVASVVGTTGFEGTELERLRAASESAPVLKAANFARGVQTLLRVVGEAAAAMEGYDVELVETHHSGKRDAPSGTARRILREIEAGRASDPGPEAGSDPDSDSSSRHDADPGADRVYGREGVSPRQEGEIGVHAVRAGDVTGIHEVLLAGNHEELRLTHRAEDRGVFAAGALDAAVWLDGRDPGWYDFGDVLSRD